jgi:soluble lytic murein transglycosylase-like protein
MFDTEIQTGARLYNVPEAWIRAVIETESSWNPNAFRAEPKINDASYGLMQLLYRTAKSLGYNGDADGLYDPAVNIDLGSKLLGQLRTKYGDDFRSIYSAYNSGSATLWQTSTQVATNVARAVDNLSKWIETGVSQFAAAPVSGPLVGLLILVFLWAWTGKKR